MGEHPYRTSTAPNAERQKAPFEDHIVDAILVVVGMLGVVIGLMHPQRAVELTLGIFLVVFVLKDGNWRLRR